MIKKMEIEDITKILTLRDDAFEDLFDCELGEWVQFLIQFSSDENFFIQGVFEEGVLTGYIAAYFIPLPICKSVQVLYSKTAGIKENKIALEELKEWGKEKGAKEATIITNNVKGHAIYGFKKTGTIMTIEL